MQFMTLVPAYGRDYKTAKAAKEDFAADKDFRWETFNGSQLINRPQIDKGTTVNIRYGGLRKIAQVKV